MDPTKCVGETRRLMTWDDFSRQQHALFQQQLHLRNPLLQMLRELAIEAQPVYHMDRYPRNPRNNQI